MTATYSESITNRVQSQLRRFILDNQFSRFSQLLRRSDGQFDVEAETESAITLLCCAVSSTSNTRNQFVRVLLDVADVNHVPTQGRSPLHRALEHEPLDLELIRLLVDARIDLSLQPTDLIAAVQTRNTDVVRMLVVDRRLKPAVLNVGQGRPLLLATSHNCSEIAKILVQAGASVRFHNSDNGKTALHHAVSHNDIELTRMLIERGAVVCSPAFNGQTPLLAAAEARTPAIVTMLVRAGADVNENDGLAIAAKHSHNTSVFREFIRCGADVPSSGALITALAHKSMDAIELLLALGEPHEVHRLNFSMQWWVHTAPLAALLYAAGATLDHRFRAADLKQEIAAATRTLFVRRLEFVRSRAFEICVALQQLELPALITLSIVDEAVLYAHTFKMHVKWNWIVAVKHFNAATKRPTA